MPALSKPRFDRHELAGAFGDIGTDLPLIAGILLATKLDPSGVFIAFGLAQIASGLLYDFDSDVVRPTAAENLTSLAASLKKYPNTELLIVGHTDALGSTTYNQDLSTRRASSASEYLMTRSISTIRVHWSGKGELEPLATNETEAGRQLNRRVEVAIFATDKARTASP